MNNDVALPAADWTSGLIRNRKGDPLGNLHNVLHALRNAPEWKGRLALDEFAMKVMTVDRPPWGNAPIKEWSDEHDLRTTEWLQAQDIPAAIGTVSRAVSVVAQENRVHPVRDYLHGLQWDGTSRLDTWLTRYLGVEDSPYSRAVSAASPASALTV